MSVTRTYNFVDKRAWGPGAWLDEPDKVQWTDEMTGLPCLAVRHDRLGHWCGYVGVAKGHPDFRVSRKQLRRQLIAHRDVNYAAFCQEGGEEQGVCHIPEPGQPDRVWWIGFDCGHAGDLSPGLDMGDYLRSVCRYRTLTYVQEICGMLALQLHVRSLETAA